MTALTYILGAPPLKVLRRRLGRAKYWMLTALGAAALYLVKFSVHAATGVDVVEFRFLAVAFSSLVILMGVFDEFEEMGFSFLTATLYTLLINSMLVGGGFALWVSFAGSSWKQLLLSDIEAVLKPVVDLNPHIQVNYFDLMVQLPSVAIILWMGAIYVSILLEKRLSAGEMAPLVKLPSLRPQLAELHFPDICVWIFIASLLGAFGNVQRPWIEGVAANTMNICLVMFFFQGIAVVAKFFASVRMGSFWQWIFMTLIVVQLFLFVSLLGLLDFWLGFRTRLDKRAEQFNRET